MDTRLTQEQKAFVKAQVAIGEFANEDEVTQAAINTYMDRKIWFTDEAIASIKRSMKLPASEGTVEEIFQQAIVKSQSNHR